MSKKIEIGPYSAYAIAVKYGYAGTEEDWIKAVEAARKSAETSASASKSAAETATLQTTEAANQASAASFSAKAAAASQTAAKASETESAKNLQGTREYYEQVRTITIGAQGWYATPEALKAAVPIGENGWWAVVGTTDTIWTWDGDTNSWKDSIQKADLSDYYTKAQADAKFGAPYTLPVATTTTLGGVKVGDNLSIDASGRLSGAAPYTLPAATVSTLGGVKVGSGLSVYSDGTITVTNVNGFTIRAQTTDPGAGSYLTNGTILLVYA